MDACEDEDDYVNYFLFEVDFSESVNQCSNKWLRWINQELV